MMCSVLLMPPIGDGDFSIIMEQDEYVPMCGHCPIGSPPPSSPPVRKPPSSRDAVAVQTPADWSRRRQAEGAWAVSFVNVESFVVYDRVPVEVPDYGRLTVSVAYGGDFYCFVDADAIGVELAPHCEPQMLAVAQKVIPAVNEQLSIRHPKRPDINRCYQTLLTSATTTVGDYRQLSCAHQGLSIARHAAPAQCQGGLLHARRLAWARNGDLLDRWVPFSGAVAVSEQGRDPLRASRVSARAT
jgi:proline racemase